MPGRWGGFGHHLCTAQVSMILYQHPGPLVCLEAENSVYCHPHMAAKGRVCDLVAIKPGLSLKASLQAERGIAKSDDRRGKKRKEEERRGKKRKEEERRGKKRKEEERRGKKRKEEERRGKKRKEEKRREKKRKEEKRREKKRKEEKRREKKRKEEKRREKKRKEG
ncbi:hypothetical protein HGM15179_009322 [Zosterops borbonicus]|uniref:Uncharacterized protein n=1 Tax=Zosterops borbonicus TaxID=364589 RepID=A0A8K1GG20_9PASS|nr:hypothetical protein HGM15179_009322 [Zosterops borbonicus]